MQLLVSNYTNLLHSAVIVVLRSIAIIRLMHDLRWSPEKESKEIKNVEVEGGGASSQVIKNGKMAEEE